MTYTLTERADDVTFNVTLHKSTHVTLNYKNIDSAIQISALYSSKVGQMWTKQILCIWPLTRKPHWSVQTCYRVKIKNNMSLVAEENWMRALVEPCNNMNTVSFFEPYHSLER